MTLQGTQRAMRRLAKGRLLLLAAALLGIAAVACEKGTYSVDLFPEMHYNQSFKYGEPPRLSPPEDAVPVTGKAPALTPAEAAAARNPVARTASTVAHARETYRVNCAMCHGDLGKGDGAVGAILVRDGYLAPPNLTAAATQAKADGELYNTITNGVVVMPKFGKLLPDSDRWELVLLLRELARQ